MENEYPLVERFMYLFMVVLQVSIFSPNDTILAQEDIHLALLSTNFSPPPLTSTNLGLSTLLGISLFLGWCLRLIQKLSWRFHHWLLKFPPKGDW